MKKYLDTLLPRSLQSHRSILAAIVLAGTQLLNQGCVLDRSGILRPTEDASADGSFEAGRIDSSILEDGGNDAGNIDSGDVSDGGIVDSGTAVLDAHITDAQADADTPTDSGEIRDAGPIMIDCGRGLIPGFPLSYDIPTGMSIAAESAVASRMPGASVTTGINWGDAPGFDFFTFDAGSPSRATGNHIYTTPGTYVVTWFVNETECGMQTFTVVNGSTTRPLCTGFSVSRNDFRVGETTNLQLIASPRSSSPGDSPLISHFTNLPTVPNTLSMSGTGVVTITAQSPPGAGTYSLMSWVTTPRGENANCPTSTTTTLTVRP